MTTELWVLLASAVLMLIMPMAYGPGFIKALGAETMIGSRANMPPVEGWFTRLKRAHANLAENLIAFAAIVLVAHAAGVHNGWTQAGAWLFLLGRLLHPVCYITEVGPGRTLAYGIGLVGTLIIAGAVLGRAFG